MSRSRLRQVDPGVHVMEASQRFMGLEIGARMTVLELDGGLLIHSPVAVDLEAVAQLGRPRWVLAPNLFHHLHIAQWAKAGAELWAAPGLQNKRADVRFAGVVEADARPFGDDVWLMPLTCFPLSNEVVVLHRPSRTLIVTDLLFNLQPTVPWGTRAVMRSLGGYPGTRTTLLERIGMRRSVARRELSALAAWDFDRIIMAHGDIVETRGKAALLEAFGWLKLASDVPSAGQVRSPFTR